MKIDDRLEARVRRILGGVVQAKPHEFDAALKALPDDKTRAQALELAITICAYILVDTYEGRPRPQDLTLVAEAVVRMEPWVLLKADEVNTFLTAVLNGTSLAEVLDPTTAVMLTFIRHRQPARRIPQDQQRRILVQLPGPGGGRYRGAAQVAKRKRPSSASLNRISHAGKCPRKNNCRESAGMPPSARRQAVVTTISGNLPPQSRAEAAVSPILPFRRDHAGPLKCARGDCVDYLPLAWQQIDTLKI